MGIKCFIIICLSQKSSLIEKEKQRVKKQLSLDFTKISLLNTFIKQKNKVIVLL